MKLFPSKNHKDLQGISFSLKEGLHLFNSNTLMAAGYRKIPLLLLISLLIVCDCANAQVNAQVDAYANAQLNAQVDAYATAPLNAQANVQAKAHSNAQTIHHLNAPANHQANPTRNTADKFPVGKWVSLFNGLDTKDWTVKIHRHELDVNYGNTFRVADSSVQVRYDKYGEFNDQFGHLYYKQPFSYYHLRLQYRFVGELQRGAPSYTLRNSGVMFHSQDPRTMLKEQDWPISVEMQFLGGLGDGKPRSTGNMCSPGTEVIYKGKMDPRHCINSKSKTYEGDQWVTAELIVLGDSLVTHIINGDTVLQYTKPQIGGGVATRYDPKIKIDGKLLKEGFIALQSEGQPVDFRRIEIMVLPKP